ncbi:hypothetical protein [Zunongwangia sp.]|uniref:hypothetical protein n=1 Tax=Zunongwangia sp. TaxID=1965325 RepID=UPI003AA7EB0A
MLDQSFSSSNFNEIFLKENRKGIFDKSHFTQEYLDKHQEFKNIVGEKLNLKKTRALTEEELDNFAERLEKINNEKEEIRLSIFEDYSNVINNQITPFQFKIVYYLLILIFSSIANAQGQGIKELYSEQFKSDWTVYENKEYVKQFIDTNVVYKLASGRSPEEELLYHAKDRHRKKSKRIAEIFSSLKIDIQQYDSLVFVEERALQIQTSNDFIKNGAIITQDSIYGFSYDPSMEKVIIKSYDYFLNSDNQTVGQAKQVIRNLVLSGKTRYLHTIAKVESEMLSGPLQNHRPDVEFEIIIYNKNGENELRRIYLHETFIQIMNQNNIC